MDEILPKYPTENFIAYRGNGEAKKDETMALSDEQMQKLSDQKKEEKKNDKKKKKG